MDITICSTVALALSSLGYLTLTRRAARIRARRAEMTLNQPGTR